MGRGVPAGRATRSGALRSSPHEARSCATRTTSWTPSPSSSTSPMTTSSGRDLWRPRNEGMAQKPQRRSHPSATLTYAHGARAAGRGRFKRSNDGRASPVSSPSVKVPTVLLPRVTGTPKPTTRSTSGSAARSWSPWRSARHPVTTRRAPSSRAAASSRMVSIDSWRAASMKAQVLTTTRSASSGEVAGS